MLLKCFCFKIEVDLVEIGPVRLAASLTTWTANIQFSRMLEKNPEPYIIPYQSSPFQAEFIK